MGDIGQEKYKRIKFKRTKRYKRLMNHDKDKLSYVLLDTPEHGNIGDQAIAVAESDFIQLYIPQRELYELSYDDCKYCIKDIKSHTSVDKDIIVIHGGGFIGTLWIKEYENFIRILRNFKDYKIVVFPQTIYFGNSEQGNRLTEEFKEFLRACRDITILVRDEQSFEWADENIRGMRNVKYMLVPDIVTSLQHGIKDLERKKEVLLCMRRDLEKQFDGIELSRVSAWLKLQGYTVVKTDTVINHSIDMEHRRKTVLGKLKQFASSSLVITDRLHGMIFSAITNTPCIALDNLSGKVRGGYQWFQHLSYIKMLDCNEVTIENVRQMLKFQNGHYDMKKYEKYYKLIEDTLIEIV